MSETIAVLFMVVVAPLWIIFHYSTKARASRGLSTEDEKMLAQLWDSAKRMEDRIETLERILDHDNPGWRRNHDQP